MTAMIVWLLIATSGGTYNGGTQNTLAMFPEKIDCEYAVRQVDTGLTRHKCVRANILVPK